MRIKSNTNLYIESQPQVTTNINTHNNIQHTHNHPFHSDTEYKLTYGWRECDHFALPQSPPQLQPLLRLLL